jgi:GntR family transcriptional regulator
MNFQNDVPIYLQIMDQIKKQIIAGKLNKGDKLSSVRELALEMKVNPNTIQRMFQELEREELVQTQRGMGRYVTNDEKKITELKEKMSESIIQSFLTEMSALGFGKDDIMKLIEKECKR